jgi:sec-independent protein translocase protein TatA
MIGAPELIAVLIAALFLFGPQKLPELARSLGSAVGEFKKAQRAAELELTDFDPYTKRAREKAATSDKDKSKEEFEVFSKGIKGEENASLKANKEEMVKKENENINREKKPKAKAENALEARKSIPDLEELEDYLKTRADSK